jgi:hypothetical protein
MSRAVECPACGRAARETRIELIPGIDTYTAECVGPEGHVSVKGSPHLPVGMRLVPLAEAA